MKTLNDYATESRKDNDKWWHEQVCAECGRVPDEQGLCLTRTCTRHKLMCRLEWVPIADRNKGELLALVHSEISECLEGVRKNLQDDKLPARSMEEVELADALIRIFDYAGAFGLDLEGAYQDKRKYNASRADHSHEARAQAGGKKF